MQNDSANNKRIAKNTLLLYVRMIFMLAVTLFTSRVILDSLGEDDYGIYNVVGGVVAMLSILSGPLSAAITRFLTYELGIGNKDKLTKVFSTSLNIQILMAVVIFFICEVVGVWFLNTQMNIPKDRLDAANFVLQCSLVTFMINFIIVPFNACIISHEKMDVFAYLSIFDVSIKLGIAYLIFISPIDKLKLYSLLLLLSSLLLFLIYSWYCRRCFEEVKFKILFDKGLFKDIASFAGWNLFGNSSWILNTQGITMLINVFFGVKVNAARAIAMQVEGALNQFVNNFTTAINPQITKSYAVKNYNYLFSLINKGSKYSYFIMFLFVVPIVLEAETILSIWLIQVPKDAVIFVRITSLASLTLAMGNSMITGIMATGDIKKYEIVITSVASLVFPLTWIAYKFGCPAYYAYIIYGIIYFSLNFIRMAFLRNLMHYPIKKYFKDVFIRLIIVSIISFSLPCIIIIFMQQSVLRLVVSCLVSIIWTLCTILILGLDKSERVFLYSKLNKRNRNLK